MFNAKKLVSGGVLANIRPTSAPVLTDSIYSTYIISTAIANASKTKFYTTDLPALENVRNIFRILFLAEKVSDPLP